VRAESVTPCERDALMSDSDRPRGDLRRTELETVTCWPVVVAALALVVVGGAAVVIVAVVSPMKREDERQANVSRPPQPQTTSATVAHSEDDEIMGLVRLRPKSGSRARSGEPSRPASEDEADVLASLTASAREIDLR